MNVVLISIIHSFKYGNTGIDYIANFLRKDKRDTIVTKYYHRNEKTRDIVDNLKRRYDLYCFSIFETNVNQAKEIVNLIKRDNQYIRVVFGGQFVTMNYKKMISDCPDTDYFVLGDGESPIKRIIEHHRDHSSLLVNDKNIALSGDSYNKIENREMNVNRSADYDYFVTDSYDNNRQKTHCIMTKSNVCSGNCSFCCSRKGKAIYKDNERIVSEIRFLSEKYGVRKYFITDDDIFDFDNDENRGRLSLLFDEIYDLNLNLTFSGFAKPISVCNPENAFLLRKMRKIGFSHLFIGIDAGNENDIRLYNKRSGVETGRKALEILDNKGIAARYGLIFYNPYSSLKSLEKNYRFLVSVKSANYYHYGGLFVQLLEGTKLLEKVRDDGLLKDSFSYDNNSDFNFKNDEVEKYARFIKDEFLVKADEVKWQFNTLKRLYSLVSTVNYDAEIYHDRVMKFEQIEFFEIKDYFEKLYVYNNIDFCRNNLSRFISSMMSRSEEYQKIIEELKGIYEGTPLRKEVKNV